MVTREKLVLSRRLTWALVIGLWSTGLAAGQNPRDRSRLPDGVTAYRDLEYASIGTRTLKLDVYVPESPARSPLVVWIHGGGWRQGSKENVGILWLTTRGFSVASVEYRLSGEATFPAQIHDCKAAIRWLRAHGEEYGYSPERIGVAGSSAGGHLAALVGTSGGVEELEGELGNHLSESSAVVAVCDLYGPTDFLQMDPHALPGSRMRHHAPQSPESRLLGGPIADLPDRVAQANPVTYVDSQDPAFLILHGDLDPLVPAHQSWLLHEELVREGVATQLVLIPGAGHGGREFSTPAIRNQIAEFFKENLEASASGDGGR